MACLYFMLAYLAQSTTANTAPDIAPYVEEAAQRSGVPQPVIWAVISVESQGQVRATSPKGAMGLMQLMPKTWSQLRAQFDLKSDAFDPHDNIVAGAFYLRYLYDRYGWGGMFAAYNAGPGRYESHRDLSRPLPTETLNYVTRIAAKLGGQSYVFGPVAVSISVPAWSEASLFVADTDQSPNPTDGFSSSQSPFVTLSNPPDLPNR